MNLSFIILILFVLKIEIRFVIVNDIFFLRSIHLTKNKNKKLMYKRYNFSHICNVMQCYFSSCINIKYVNALEEKNKQLNYNVLQFEEIKINFNRVQKYRISLLFETNP